MQEKKIIELGNQDKTEATKKLELIKTSKEAAYAEVLNCSIEVFGGAQVPTFEFNAENGLAAITIPLNQADDKLREELDKKYTLSLPPSEAQLNNVNPGLSALKWVYAKGAVVLIVNQILGNVSIFISYNDPETAKALITEAQKDIPKASDL